MWISTVSYILYKVSFYVIHQSKELQTLYTFLIQFVWKYDLFFLITIDIIRSAFQNASRFYDSSIFLIMRHISFMESILRICTYKKLNQVLTLQQINKSSFDMLSKLLQDHCSNIGHMLIPIGLIFSLIHFYAEQENRMSLNLDMLQ